MCPPAKTRPDILEQAIAAVADPDVIADEIAKIEAAERAAAKTPDTDREHPTSRLVPATTTSPSR